MKRRMRGQSRRKRLIIEGLDYTHLMKRKSNTKVAKAATNIKKNTVINWIQVDSCEDGTPIKLAIYERGNPCGYPLIYLHGGPGGNYESSISSLFDLKKYHFISFDQRSCGNSTPRLMIEKDKNTTQRLIEDIETIRRIVVKDAKKWLVVGGSWGSSLAMLYAQSHPDRVSGMILRGFSDLTEDEITNPLYSQMFTEVTDEYFKLYGMDYRKKEELKLSKKIHERFTKYLPSKSSVRYDKSQASRHIMRSLTKKDKRILEMFSDNQVYTIANLKVVNRTLRKIRASKRLKRRQQLLKERTRKRRHAGSHDYDKESNIFRDYADALVMYHYAINNFFLKKNQIVLEENVRKVRHIPTIFVQGRFDIVCPYRMAYEMHKKLSKSELWVAHAGHLTQNAQISDYIRKAGRKLYRVVS